VDAGGGREGQGPFEMTDLRLTDIRLKDALARYGAIPEISMLVFEQAMTSRTDADAD
jgi:hypothetical protein